MIGVRRVVIRGGKFVVARKLADAGIPFIFVKEAGSNTVGDVPSQHLSKLSTFLHTHPELEGRFAKNPDQVSRKDFLMTRKDGGLKKALPMLLIAGAGLLLVTQARGGTSFLPFGQGAPVYPPSQWWYNPATGQYTQGGTRPSARAVPVQVPPESSVGGQILQSAAKAVIPPATSLVARWVQNLFQADQGPIASSPLGVLGFDQPIQTDYGIPPLDYVEPFSGDVVQGVLPEPTVTVDTPPVDLIGYMDYQEPIYYLDEFGMGGEGAPFFDLSLELI